MNRAVRGQLLAAALLVLTMAVGCIGTDPARTSDPAGKTVEEMLGTDSSLEPIYFDGKPYVLSPDVSSYLFIGVDKPLALGQEKYMNLSKLSKIISEQGKTVTFA